MFQQPNEIQFQLPDWIEPYAQRYQPTQDLAARMRFVVGAARMNIEQKTGGPFAAAIFEMESGVLISLGVNLVTTAELSILHAEMVAITLAQKKLGHYDLGSEEMAAHELVTSTEPCAMCFGAIPWSGVRHVATAAQDQDARAIGFDEGPKPAHWVEALTERNIQVTTEVERERGRDVLQHYLQHGGHIYNSREDIPTA